MNEHIERGIAAFGIVGTLAFGAWAGTAISHADEQDMITWVDPATGEAWLSQEDCPNVACYPLQATNLTDISDTWWYTVDQIPVCAEEDCSDQPGQIGMWLDSDTGNWYLSTGEESVLVIDDTVGWDAGYEN